MKTWKRIRESKKATFNPLKTHRETHSHMHATYFILSVYKTLSTLVWDYPKHFHHLIVWDYSKDFHPCLRLQKKIHHLFEITRNTFTTCLRLHKTFSPLVWDYTKYFHPLFEIIQKTSTPCLRLQKKLSSLVWDYTKHFCHLFEITQNTFTTCWDYINYFYHLFEVIHTKYLYYLLKITRYIKYFYYLFGIMKKQLYHLFEVMKTSC